MENFIVGQDCVSHYGNKVVKWEIQELSIDNKRELIEDYCPKDRFFARHTHNKSGKFIVYDQKKYKDVRIFFILLVSIPFKLIRKLRL